DAVLVGLGDGTVVAGDDQDHDILVLEVGEGILLAVGARKVAEARGRVAGLEDLVPVANFRVLRGIRGDETRHGKSNTQRQQGGGKAGHAFLHDHEKRYPGRRTPPTLVRQQGRTGYSDEERGAEGRGAGWKPAPRLRAGYFLASSASMALTTSSESGFTAGS